MAQVSSTAKTQSRLIAFLFIACEEPSTQSDRRTEAPEKSEAAGLAAAFEETNGQGRTWPALRTGCGIRMLAAWTANASTVRNCTRAHGRVADATAVPIRKSADLPTISEFRSRQANDVPPPPGQNVVSSVIMTRCGWYSLGMKWLTLSRRERRVRDESRHTTPAAGTFHATPQATVQRGTRFAFLRTPAIRFSFSNSLEDWHAEFKPRCFRVGRD
jgi:hypothetical protein